MAAPRVSVVIPVHNRPARVQRAIRSVLTQTYQDFEIVVVDDASTDDTGSAASSIADRRIRLCRHETNRGGSAARNTGIEQSSGELVAFLDSDDEWLPTKLERQVKVLDTGGPNVGLVYTGADLVYPSGAVLKRPPHHRGNISRELLTENVVGGTSTGVVRRSVLAEVGAFDESLPAMQEMDLWLRISERSEVDFVPGCHVRIYKDDDAGRISMNLESRVRARELFFEKHRDKLVDARVTYKYFRSSGRLWHRREGSIARARQFYVESLKAKPLNPTAMFFLAISMVPDSLFDACITVKRSLFAPRPMRRRAAGGQL